MEFESARLSFREFTDADFMHFCSVLSNEQVMQYAYLDATHDESQLHTYFDEILANNGMDEAERKNYSFAVFSREDGSHVGFADLIDVTKKPEGGIAEIGYFLLPPWWGQGYATEIAKALIDFGFDRLKLHRLCASCNAQNHPSEKIMQKVGMQKEGVFRQARYKNSVWVDELRYAIIKD